MLPRFLALWASLVLVGCQVESNARPQSVHEDHASVERAVAESLQAEQRAFRDGDCAAAVEFVAEDAHLVVGGSTTTRDAMRSMCERIAASGVPFKRAVSDEKIQVLSTDTAYSVTTYAIGPPGQGPRGTQVVTKIWQLRGGKWRIVHFHESVNRPRSRNQ